MVCQILIRRKIEELVLDDGTAQRRSDNSPVDGRLGNGRYDALRIRNCSVFGIVVEEVVRVQPAEVPVAVQLAMHGVRAGLGSNINVRAGCGPLRSVVLRRVDAQLLNGFGRRGKPLTDGVVDGRIGLNRGSVVQKVFSRIQNIPVAADLAG